MPYKRPMTVKGLFKKYEYVYDEYYDCYICPNFACYNLKKMANWRWKTHANIPSIIQFLTKHINQHPKNDTFFLENAILPTV